MSNSIRIKRRASGNSGAPSSLKNGELAFNEVDDILYYGKGTTGGGDTAATIEAIGGEGHFAKSTDIPTNANFVDRSTAQNVGGIKTLTALLNADGGIKVNTNKFSVVAASGNTTVGGIFGVVGRADIAGVLNADGGIAVDTNKFTVADGTGNVSTAGDIAATGSLQAADSAFVVSSTGVITSGEWNGTAIASAYIGNLNASKITSGTLPIARGGTGAASAAAAATALGLGTGNSPTFAGATLTATLNADGGINVNSGKFTVSSTDGSITTSNGSFVINDSGHITSGEYKASPIAAAYIGSLPASKITSGTIPIARGGTGATSATAAASALGLGTEDSPTFTQVTVSGSGGFVGSGAGLTSVPAGNLTGNINTARLPVATATAKGAIELFSGTAQSVAANTVTTTASRTYGIQLNSDGQAVVNVPWTDAASSTRASLNIDTDDDVVFKNLELGGASGSATIKGPAELKIDPAAHGDDTGTVVISGNLQVDGTTTTVNSTIVEVADKALDLAPTANTNALIDGAGIRLGDDGNSPRGGLVEFIWSNSNTRMELSSALHVNGGLKASSLVGCTIDGGTF